MYPCSYKRAAFCVEELLLVDPHNHLYPQHYAELLYTMGGVENLDMARKYFAQSLKINPNNMRALYGFYLVGNECTRIVVPCLWFIYIDFACMLGHLFICPSVSWSLSVVCLSAANNNATMSLHIGTSESCSIITEVYDLISSSS